jgi:hypothetical protein
VRTRVQARAFAAALPCATRLLATRRDRGQGEAGLTIAVLRLTERSGATCRGRRSTARVGFAVDHGRITHWIRLADAPRTGG